MRNRLISKTGAALVQDFDRLKRDAARVVQDVQEHAQMHVTAARERVGQTVDSVRQKFNSNPLYVLGFGFVLGLYFGLRLAGRGGRGE